MGIISTLVNIARGAWNFITGLPGDIGRALQSLWNFARQVQQVADYVLSHPLTEVLDTLAILMATLTGNHEALVNALRRIDPWIYHNRVLPLRSAVLLWFAQLRARIAYLFALAYLYIGLKFRQAEQYALALVQAEHADMLRHFTEAEHYAYEQALMRYQAIEREAADTYNARLPERLGIAKTLADLIATRNPLVRGLLSDLVTGIEDLGLADTLLGRLILGVIVRQVISRLTVDRAAGVLLSSMLGPLLGRPRARGVADVVGDLADRVSALEDGQATFMRDGGPEILQAGQDWAEITGLAVDAALLGFVAATIAAPAQAARDTAAAVLPVTGAAAAAWHRLIT